MYKLHTYVRNSVRFMQRGFEELTEMFSDTQTLTETN